MAYTRRDNNKKTPRGQTTGGSSRSNKPYSGNRKPAGKPDGERRPEGGYRSSSNEKPFYGDKSKSRQKPAYGEKANRDEQRTTRGEKSYADKTSYPKNNDRRTQFSAPKTRPAQTNRPPKQVDSPAVSLDTTPAVAPAVPALEEAQLPYFLMGRNTVREAIKSGRSIDRILVLSETDGSLREIIALARDRKLVVRQVDRKQLDELCMPFGHGGKPGNHQGIIAMVPDIEYVELDDLLAIAKERNEPPFLLILDEINDPYNLGSMLRSAACAGVHGVIIPKRRAASVTTAVSKASAGAVEYVKVAKVVNLAVAIERLKKEGVWIAGADMQGTPMASVNMRGPLAIVIGNENSGLSRLIRDNCDHLVSIPMRGEMDSLNASVAAAILLFEKNRQDGA
ncbi:23S rRNA (guanosine(2251)-2'-O)-methyltransferase RlmB [Christensenellaceae bacterium OttesenSCG-928-L17]|nr:23S rRNA (guanosine(2251)-2'-O)-methyltransferase RlmB [Christensenellaceae bacterium OttesenSCG-928-L17]